MSSTGLDSHFLLRLTCVIDFLYRSPEGFILTSLRPQNLLFYHRDINHMKVVVVHIFAQSFGHCPVALVGVHHSGEDILLTAYDLHGGFIGIGIKLFRKFIAAVSCRSKQSSHQTSTLRI